MPALRSEPTRKKKNRALLALTRQELLIDVAITEFLDGICRALNAATLR